MSEILETLLKHVNCTNSTIPLLENMTGDLFNLYHLLVNTSKVEDIKEGILTLNKLFDSYLLWKIINEQFKIVAKEMNSCLGWMYYSVRIEKPTIKSTFNNFRKRALNDHRKESYELSAKTISLDYNVSSSIIPQCMNYIRAYLERNMTKRQLGTNLNGLTFIKVSYDIAAVVAGSTLYLTQFNKKVDTLNLIVTEGLRNLTHLTLPILNRVNVHDLSFMKDAENLLNRNDFNNVIKSFDEDFHGNFIKFLRMNYDGFAVSTNRLLNNISATANDLTKHVTRFQDDLAKYKASTDLNVEFYKSESILKFVKHSVNSMLFLLFTMSVLVEFPYFTK